MYATELIMAPSASCKRQCVASVACDEAPVPYVIDWLGDARLVFSTAFPHGDATFLHAVESLLQLAISEDSKRKILWATCAAYYGLTA